MFLRKVHQHGHSLVVGIPAAVCRDLEIHRGDYIVGKIDENFSIVLGKVRPENLSYYKEHADPAV